MLLIYLQQTDNLVACPGPIKQPLQFCSSMTATSCW
jgi:hypothetical protein